MRRYDPDEAPRASAWLALDEGERLRLVEQYHEHEDPELPNVRLHSSIHVIVENQLAEGVPASRRAFERVRSHSRGGKRRRRASGEAAERGEGRGRPQCGIGASVERVDG